jgi:hypothetical protein
MLMAMVVAGVLVVTEAPGAEVAELPLTAAPPAAAGAATAATNPCAAAAASLEAKASLARWNWACITWEDRLTQDTICF